MDAVECDVLVVGGGCAGLYAALRCREAGLDVIVAESTAVFGGATASDTGHAWLPSSTADRPAGPAGGSAASVYLDAVLGEATPSSSAARRAAFVRTSPAVVTALGRHGVPLAAVRGRCDDHPAAPGARRSGRVLATTPFDLTVLGESAALVRPGGHDVDFAPRTPRGLLGALVRFGARLVHRRADLVTGGTAFAGRLLKAAERTGVTLWTSASLVGLLSEGERVCGVRLRREGALVEVRARRGVILACGGFEGDAGLRRTHLPQPSETSWTTGLASNTGAGLRAALELDALTAELDQAWWTIVAVFSGRTWRVSSERAKPHSIVVDRAGDRFFNEASPGPEAGRALLDRDGRVRAVPSYLVLDSRHRHRYRLGPWLPGSTPTASTGISQAPSVAELATALGVDQAGLIGTVVRFNGLAAQGKDTDFGRGASPADRVHGDPTSRPNPCLGPLDHSPLWAVEVYPGDDGTKGGVLIDEHARVLRTDGPIPGLYAVAGTAATLFKGTSPGSGAALGSALVDAHLAVAHLATADDAASD